MNQNDGDPIETLNRVKGIDYLVGTLYSGYFSLSIFARSIMVAW